MTKRKPKLTQKLLDDINREFQRSERFNELLAKHKLGYVIAKLCKRAREWKS